MRSIVFSCFLMVFLISCRGDFDYEELKPGLISQWIWESSSGGIAGVTHTPESTGDHIVIEFTADSLYREYRQGSLIREERFHIMESWTIYSEESVKIIFYDDHSINQSYAFDNEFLYLYDEVYDGFIHRYKRKRESDLQF